MAKYAVNSGQKSNRWMYVALGSLLLLFIYVSLVVPMGHLAPLSTVGLDGDQVREIVRQELIHQAIPIIQSNAYGTTEQSYSNNKNKQQHPATRMIPEGRQLRILVTGGSGFVGSHLVDRLMREGHRVTVLDNFFTGRQRNVQRWIGHENFALLTRDVVEPILIEVDQIYHLACPASPPHYQYNPIKTIKTNTKGTLNVLGLAKRVNASVLLASTSEVCVSFLIACLTTDYNCNTFSNFISTYTLSRCMVIHLFIHNLKPTGGT